jgi:hypothetical protein
MKATFWSVYSGKPQLLGTLTVINGEAVPDALWLTNYTYPSKAPRNLPFDGELVPLPFRRQARGTPCLPTPAPRRALTNESRTGEEACGYITGRNARQESLQAGRFPHRTSRARRVYVGVQQPAGGPRLANASVE